MHWIEAYNHDFQRVLTKWYNSVKNSKLVLVLRLPNGTSLDTEMSKTYTFFLTTSNNVGMQHNVSSNIGADRAGFLRLCEAVHTY